MGCDLDEDGEESSFHPDPEQFDEASQHVPVRIVLEEKVFPLAGLAFDKRKNNAYSCKNICRHIAHLKPVNCLQSQVTPSTPVQAFPHTLPPLSSVMTRSARPTAVLRQLALLVLNSTNYFFHLVSYNFGCVSSARFSPVRSPRERIRSGRRFP